MKKLLIVSSVALTLFIIAAFGYARLKNSANQTTNDFSPATAAPLPQTEEMVDSKNGVDFSVDEIKRANGQTVLTVGINNHVEDYSQIDLKDRSDLAGVKPLKYQVDTAAGGGHHVSGELVFAGELSGLLTVRLTDELIFNINVK